MAVQLSEEKIEDEPTSKHPRLGDVEPSEISHISPLSPIPENETFQYLIAFGEKGIAPGQLLHLHGLLVHEETQQIYVADSGNRCVHVFDESGNFLNRFGKQYLSMPYGISLHDDSLYITDTYHHAIFQFTYPDHTMRKRIGTNESTNEQFNFPCQIAISPNQNLYVADRDNDRLQVLNCCLDFKGRIRHQTMTGPVDVKFSTNQMLVLSFQDNPCLHLFTFTGEKLRSIITRGYCSIEINRAFFFCLDGHSNIIISDFSANEIKVFSPVGDLLHSIGELGEGPGKLDYPTGIAILNRTKLVCLCDNATCCLQIFYSCKTL